MNLAGMGALSHNSTQNLSPQSRAAAAAGGPAARKAAAAKRMSKLTEEEDDDENNENKGKVTADLWEFPREKLYLREKLGEGAFGEVWKVAAEGITRTPGMTTVAVKLLRRKLC